MYRYIQVIHLYMEAGGFISHAEQDPVEQIDHLDKSLNKRQMRHYGGDFN